LSFWSPPHLILVFVVLCVLMADFSLFVFTEQWTGHDIKVLAGNVIMSFSAVKDWWIHTISYLWWCGSCLLNCYNLNEHRRHSGLYAVVLARRDPIPIHLWLDIVKGVLLFYFHVFFLCDFCGEIWNAKLKDENVDNDICCPYFEWVIKIIKILWGPTQSLYQKQRVLFTFRHTGNNRTVHLCTMAEKNEIHWSLLCLITDNYYTIVRYWVAITNRHEN